MKFKMIIVLGIAAVVLLLFSPVLIYRSTVETRTFTVKDKERIVKSKSSYYLIWTESGDVYKNGDSLSFLKFDSSDIYGQLEVGKTYTAKVAGWRIRFLSMYENIISLQE